MKIGGRLVKPNEEILVLPRIDGDIVIKAKSVAINDDFKALVPEPVAPAVLTKDGQGKDYKDKSYRQQIVIREEKRMAFLVLRSLEPSDIEWEGIDLDKHETWLGWSKELQDAGLSEVETNRIINCVMCANSLDDEKIKEAREAFLRGQGE